MQMRTYCGVLLLCLLSSLSTANTAPAYTWEYIKNYSDIAIREMQRSGIPASITLAQGIHESSWGRGDLSLNSNNHFGIKCKKEWQGNSFYYEDDDYVNGRLIKSCFRVYNTVEDSYIDHTNFLVGNSRYQSLFQLSTTDYKAWAKGLKKCGYATDPNYADKLIKTIEEYQLQQYDNPAAMPEMPVMAQVENNAINNANSLDVPDLEAPAAFVLPDDYQRNSRKSEDAYFDQASYLPYTTTAVQQNVVIQKQRPTLPIETKPMENKEDTMEASTDRPHLQSPPVYSAPGYSIASSPATKAQQRPREQDIIRASTGNKGTQIQLSRKPRGDSRVLR
ncbi:MAG: glucosaminidase domain-containing protein [Bacteroidota bacterium]